MSQQHPNLEIIGKFFEEMPWRRLSTGERDVSGKILQEILQVSPQYLQRS